MKDSMGMCGERVWSCTVGDLQRSFHSSVLLHHVKMVSSISSLESGRLAIFFKDRRWHSDSRSLLAESRMAVIPWIVERAQSKHQEQSFPIYIIPCTSVNHSGEPVVSPAWFPLPGGVVAGWRWCVHSELWRWCSCPWCCPADSSAGAWWDWHPRRVLPGLWTPTTPPALTPVWCHWTDSEDTAWSHRQPMLEHRTSIYDTLLLQVLIAVSILLYTLCHGPLSSSAAAWYLISISLVSAFIIRF